MSHPSQLWCTRRLLVTVEGPQGTSVIPQPRPFARIGRQPGSDIVLDSPWVAKRSLYLHATDEGVYCFYLQPEENQEQRLGFWLAPGEPLLVGPYRISAALEGFAHGPAPALVPLDEWGSVQPPFPLFQVYSDGKLRDKRRFRARLNLIGRRHECALQIKGQQVSAFHGGLYWHNTRLWYVDLMSSNGTTLNGVPIDFGEIRVGDRLEIGEFTLLFQRLSQRGTVSVQSPAGVGTEPGDSVSLPADFDDDLPLELDSHAIVEVEDSRPGSTPDSAPGIGTPEEDDHFVSEDLHTTSAAFLKEPVPRQRLLGRTVSAATHAPAPPAEAAARAAVDQNVLAPIQQTRKELALLQQRVQELTQQTAQVRQNTAEQLLEQTKEAFERERQRIAHELERSAGELAREKQALELQWQTASRELTTQVNQLRDEANLLARQRLAMEQSRLLWDQQRTELESQLRSYAQQLARLQQGGSLGLPAPVAEPAEDLPALPRHSPPDGSRDIDDLGQAASLIPAAANHNALVARSHVVQSHVESHRESPGSAARMPLLLEGSLSSTSEEPAEPLLLRREAPPSLAIKGRKSPKGARPLDAVTDHIVERERSQHRKLMILGVAVSVVVVVVAVALIVVAVLWK